MKTKCVGLILLSILLGSVFTSQAEEYYEKSEIRTRMEKREVISVVKVIPFEKGNKLKGLDMTAAGIIDGVTISKAMKLMSDYEDLQKIAPDYIKLSELIVIKEKGEYQKYLHMKTEVSTLLGAYKMEVYSKVSEEEFLDRGLVHWEIIDGKTIGRPKASNDFVGLKGSVSVGSYERAGGSDVAHAAGQGFHRSRPQKDQLRMLFKGRLDRDETGINKIIPNFVLQFAMEVALQRVGVLLRNYLETAKETPKPVNLDELWQREQKRQYSSIRR